MCTHVWEHVSKLLVSFLGITLGFLPSDAQVRFFVLFFFFLSPSMTLISKGTEVIASVMAEFFMQKHLNLSLALNLGVISLTAGSAPWILDVHTCHHLSQCWVTSSQMSLISISICISLSRSRSIQRVIPKDAVLYTYI